MPVINKDGIAKVKVISPGHGSSGYYAPAVLEAATAKFTDAQCFWNHPSLSENKERPERDLRDLAGKIQGTPQWMESGPTGPGIYADVKVYEHFQKPVEDMAADIGMSIRAMGKARLGEVDGKKTKVIEGIDSVRSVDFVTLPGRGGEILQLFEAARPAQEIPALTLEGLKREHPELVESLRAEIKSAVYGAKDKLKEDKRMNEDEIKALEESNKEAADKIAKLEETNARLQEAEVLREAAGIVAAKLAESKLPDITKARLTESLSSNPPIVEGKLDEENYSQQITKAILDEATYIATIKESGKITGMGSSAPASDEGHGALEESFKASFISQGCTPEEAEAMAKTAANRR